MRLTVKRVARLLSAGTPGRHFDAAGLYLVIESKTNAHWERRYQLHGKTHYLGLGSARRQGSKSTFTLEEAREENRQISQQLTKKIDPLKARRAERAQRAAEEAHSITFGEAAEEYFKTNAPTWRHRAHVAQWSATVLGRTPQGRPARQDYCRSIRHLPVQCIDTPIIMGVLRPIWHERPETASRIRARVATVLDWSKAAGYRTGDNSAAWEIIGKLLPSRGKVAKVKHLEAVPYAEMPAFMSELRKCQGSAARALEFAILSAARTGEVLGATWPEIEIEEGLWVIPAERMKKTDREHRVPLSPQAVQLLRALPREPDSSVVFIGPQEGRGLSDAALLGVMRRMGRTETPHGFRSSFSDWAHEQTSHTHHAIEASLSHTVGTDVERAYRRGDLFKKRRKLMQHWAEYCESPQRKATGKVVSIRAG
jgi:integrase